MKKTVSMNHFVDGVEEADSSFSYNGAKALYEYLIELEADIGEDIEFDPVAIRCEWCEYESATDAAVDLLAWVPRKRNEDEYEEDAQEENDEKAMKKLEYNTTVICIPDGGVVVNTSF